MAAGALVKRNCGHEAEAAIKAEDTEKNTETQCRELDFEKPSSRITAISLPFSYRFLQFAVLIQNKQTNSVALSPQANYTD
jgi:hypothetical protein